MNIYFIYMYKKDVIKWPTMVDMPWNHTNPNQIVNKTGMYY